MMLELVILYAHTVCGRIEPARSGSSIIIEGIMVPAMVGQYGPKPEYVLELSALGHK